jgi:hypothetical protein
MNQLSDPCVRFRVIKNGQNQTLNKYFLNNGVLIRNAVPHTLRSTIVDQTRSIHEIVGIWKIHQQESFICDINSVL